MESANTQTDTVTVLHNATIVTMDSETRVFRNGGIVIESDRIKAVDQSAQILHYFSSIADEIVDLQGKILLPGFINTHVHTSQQLGRGIADDVDLVTWLHRRIWPYESNMTECDSYISTLLCGIELIRSGVTCFAEAGGQHVSAMAKAVEELGLRACLTESIMDTGEGLPVSWRYRSTDECIQIQLENQVVVDTRQVDHGTVTYLEKINFLQSNLLAAHTVCVNDTEVTPLVKSNVSVKCGLPIKLSRMLANISCLSKAGVKVSHCPASAMRMLGFAPIKEMLNANICVSLGTDGAPSNNRMSIVDEMYLASLINKGREVYARGTTDPAAFSAEIVLKLATINGAKTVLWDSEIGSLEVGKK
ncbi:Amidohydrolase-related, partial [Dillenia turbinata]